MKQMQFRSKSVAAPKGPQMIGNNALKTQLFKSASGKVVSMDTKRKLNTKLDLKAKMANNKPVFETGDNCKNRTVKRGYLGSDEVNIFMNMFACVQLVEGVRNLEYKESSEAWGIWKEKGIITPEQQKNLKLFVTYGAKFLNDVFNNNLDSGTKDSLSKKLLNYDYRITDDYTLRKVYAMFEGDKEYSISKDNFFDMVESKMITDCKGCTKCRDNCDTFKLFDDYLVPPVSENSACTQPNCEYAYV